MIKAVAIADQRICEPGHIDEAMPVGVVAGEARHLEPKDQSGAAVHDLGGEPIKSGTRDNSRAREAEILVNDDDTILGPTQVTSLGDKRILPVSRLAIVLYLPRGRLTQI